MKIIYIKITLAFILEILLSTFFKNTNYLLPLFVFFITVEESIKLKQLKKSLIFSFIIGFIYDIVMTNTYFLNAFIFLIMTFIMKNYNKYINKNKLTFLLYFLLELFLYRLITYLVLVIIQYKPLSFSLFIKSISSSILLNLIFIKCYQKSYKKL